MKADHCWHQLHSFTQEIVLECCRCLVESHSVSTQIVSDNCEAEDVEEG